MRGVSWYISMRFFEAAWSIQSKNTAIYNGAHRSGYKPSVESVAVLAQREISRAVTQKSPSASMSRGVGKTESDYAEVSKKLRQEMQEIKMDNGSKYYVEVYFTRTDQRHGTGHVSMSFIEETKSGEFILREHMSYMPTAGMSLLNGVSLGTIPVFSESVDNIREDDLHKATSMYRLSVTREEFERGLQKDHEIKDGVSRNEHLYAVTGRGNILSVYLTSLYGHYLTHNKAIDNYKLCYGVAPGEDSLGIIVTDLDSLPDKPVEAKLYNCTQAVSSILKAIGLPIDDDAVLPNALSNEVSELPGMTLIHESMVPVVDFDETEENFANLESDLHESPDLS